MTKSETLSTPNDSGWDVALPAWRDMDGNAWRVLVRLKEISGRKEVVALQLEPRRPDTVVTQRVLRALPLSKAMRDLVAPSVGESRPACESFSIARYRGTLNDAHLQRVADAYMAAYTQRQPVQQAVADELGLPLSTAAKQIMAARRRGLIPPDAHRRTTNGQGHPD